MESSRKHSLLYAGFLAAVCLALSFSTAAQTPDPSPTPTTAGTFGDFVITSSIELGVRALDVNGDHEKYRSDLNYKPGFRVFDSSFLVENNSTGHRPFDSMLVQSSGWGSDPSSSFRMNVDRTSFYKLDANVRRVRYFNNLKNHVVAFSQPVALQSLHQANTHHHFGDFDLTIFPERSLRFRLGYSYNDTKGPGTNTIRFSSDEYQLNSEVKSHSDDFRAGVEGTLWGFNLGLNYGHRKFRDKTQFFQNGFNPGINTAPSTSFLTSATRQFDVDGSTDFFHLFAQRTFAKKLDFTGRFIYSESNSDIFEHDSLTGRASSTGNFILLNLIDVPGEAKRPQSRADLGATYRVTDKFRISNTFTFDQFNIGGSNILTETQNLANSSGTGIPSTLSRSSSWRGTSYQRFANLIEGDYQFNRRFAVNLGYRYTHREVTVAIFDVNLVTGALQREGEEDVKNSTNTIIFGARVKPTNNWTVYFDLERGDSDNVFTRLANNDFFNYRIRSLASYRQFTFNLSFISKDNESPGTSTVVLAGGNPETVANNDTQIFSGSVDWTPMSKLSVSAGYTYHRQNGKTDIIVPVGTPIITTGTQFLLGISEYYVRDNYFFFDIHARPFRRVSVFATYRFNDDGGQGDRIQTRPQDIITSYPMTNHAPEIKLAIRLTKNIDWNLGYQYYSYSEVPHVNAFATPLVVFPAQNYNAHMPYTSLRFYFGRSTDR